MLHSSGMKAGQCCMLLLSICGGVSQPSVSAWRCAGGLRQDKARKSAVCKAVMHAKGSWHDARPGPPCAVRGVPACSAQPRLLTRCAVHMQVTRALMQSTSRRSAPSKPGVKHKGAQVHLTTVCNLPSPVHTQIVVIGGLGAATNQCRVSAYDLL
eukprot:1124864-Pelagomonas_calceolata.AAC.1